jgi:DNA-binding GntR family transcriptional regulator
VKDVTPIEALLDRLVADEGLEPGALMPPVDTLAERFGRGAEEVRMALAAAAGRGKFKLRPDGGANVSEPPISATSDPFSFSTSAAEQHERLVTTLLEPVAIRPPLADDSSPFYELEKRAQRELDLTPDQPMTVILRVRHLQGRPLVLHRIYLDATRFPRSIVEDHYLETGSSVLALYRDRGYQLLSRDTVLQARLTNLYEDNTLLRYGCDVYLQAVLDAEQRFFASSAKDPEPFVLEYMQATYFEHWKYKIHNRPAER